MELYARIFIVCLLCVAHASKMPQEKTAEFKAGSLTHVEDPSGTSTQKTDEIDGKSTENPRDKRALGLLLSGLAQIFGYTVTPIQFASLPNPSVTTPAAMPSLSKPNVKQQAASSRPANTTVPKQQETIRFTGVLNLGNNSDIIGHLQRYEQIFHGGRNNTMTMPMSQPAPMPMLPAKLSLDLGTNLQMRPPLLAPFFVKIPLPIAPDLVPITMPEDLGLSPPVSTASGSKENAETPVRKEQEMVYRSNEDTERYTVQEKDIYDEKDVKKPMDNCNQQREERVKKLKQQEEKRSRDKAARYNEINERNRHREEEVANRNRDHASKYESTEERGPTRHDDEEDEGSAERDKEYASQENPSNESLQPPKKSEKEESEDYSNYDDAPNKQSNGYKKPENLNNYVEEIQGYKQQLPIGDYFHEGNPEMIRDSYGEVLDNKKLEDDRIAGYINMFKHLHVQADPEDAPREANGKETSAEDGYDEHLIRLQKLREEYALPENKYEEYDLNEESEADGNDRESKRIQNTPVRSRRPKMGRLRNKEDDRARRPTGSNRDDVASLENARSQEEADFTGYMPLVVPIRYVDANDKLQEATIRQLNYKEADKSTDSRVSEDNVSPTQTDFKEELTPQIGLPERPRQLHEGEHKELQVWPSPFDYAYDNTESVNTVVPPNPRNYYPTNYAPNHYQHVVRGIAAQDANDKTTEQPSGYLVVVGNPAYPYRYPYNIYYFSNEAVSSRGQAPQPHVDVTPRPRDQVYVAQQSANQPIVQVKPNITEYNLNETASSPRDYHYQSQEIPESVLDRYRYVVEEGPSQDKEPIGIDIRSQILNTENWSNRIYRPQPSSNTAGQSPRPIFTQLRNVASSNQNAQRSSERPRYSRLLSRQMRTVRPEDNRRDDEEAETPRPIPMSKPFDDPQSAHDFFGFSKDDYSFGGESSDATKVAEENGKTAEESDALVAPEPTAYHHDDESIVIQTDEPENDTEKAKVREYRNKVATLRVTERRQLKPNGPIHYVDFIRNI